ncbi:MAG TPA: hypothetical protein VM820_11720 [Vicinamibacterales bacterium]|nr:hypothetical protein [Vicinamibacterales bacterium]
MGRRTLVVGLLGVVLALLAFAAGWVAGRTGMGTAVPLSSLEARERAFVDEMRGVVLDGVFTVDGRDGTPTPDRYEIASVEKVGDDLWRFNARMVHDTTDVTLPIVVPMKWVDDTPVVTLTDYSIPTLGTFSARVFFYSDRYAGTWQHGNEIGGHLYGRIER